MSFVSVQHLQKGYAGTPVFSDINCEIAKGEFVTLLGPSGCGKSTLLRTINHLEKIDSGHITIDGEYVGYRRKGDLLYELKEREILKRRIDVGFVFQNFNLFPHLTAWENVAEAPLAHKRWSKADAQAKATALLAKVGLADKVDAYPRQLSGGQQQRVLLARGLMQQTEILLLDEPCSAIDPPTREHLLKVMRDQAEAGQTLLVSSHDWGSALDSYDQVVVMDGQILAKGSPSSVREKLSDLTCMMGSHCCG